MNTKLPTFDHLQGFLLSSCSLLCSQLSIIWHFPNHWFYSGLCKEYILCRLCATQGRCCHESSLAASKMFWALSAPKVVRLPLLPLLFDTSRNCTVLRCLRSLHLQLPSRSLQSNWLQHVRILCRGRRTSKVNSFSLTALKYFHRINLGHNDLID